MSSLWESISSSGPAAGAFHGRLGCVALQERAAVAILGGPLESFRGRSVLLSMREQLSTALALLELDGVARRLVLCTPNLTPEQLLGVGATAEADIVLDSVAAQPLPATLQRRATETTEWILLTSGTTGVPKLVVHSFESLAGALPRHPPSTKPMVWSTFYDIRRYGGLQIYLRAVLSGSPLVLSNAGETTGEFLARAGAPGGTDTFGTTPPLPPSPLVLSNAGEPTGEFLARAGAAGVTHISGTPSHWRRALMSGDTALIEPEYARLSGEVADQTVLDNLRAAYPHARIAHAFASTEAGVAFDVNDGLAGFPESLIGNAASPIAMKVQDGTLWIRSQRNAARYLGSAQAPIIGEDGYVDTGDLVELANGRYYFRGRKVVFINVVLPKLPPQKIKSFLNADPRV